MKKIFTSCFLIIIVTCFACPLFSAPLYNPGSVPGPNSITGAQVQDNAISQRHVKFPTTNGYMLIWSPVANSVRFNLIKGSTSEIVTRFEVEDDGDVYLKSMRAADGAFVGSFEFDPISFATFITGGTGSYFRISGFDNLTIVPPLFLTTPLGLASGGIGSNNAADARANLGLVINTDVLSPTGDGSGLTGLTKAQVGLSNAVEGPASATNLAVAIFDQTSGKLLKNSLCTISAAGALTCPEFVSSCVPADNACGGTVNNNGDPTGANLASGRFWFNLLLNMMKIRNSDNTANLEIFTSGAPHTGNFYTTGTLNGGQKTVAKTNNVTLAGAEVYGTWIEAGAGADNITLPAVSANMSVCVMATDNVQKRIIPNGSDAIIYMNGTDFGNGHYALSTEATATAPKGEFLCLKGSATANKWRTTGRGATAWTDGGAP